MSGRYSASIPHVISAALNIYSSQESACTTIHRAYCVTHLCRRLQLHVIAHICKCIAGMMLAEPFPVLRVGEAAAAGGWGLTNIHGGTLSAATQSQTGIIPTAERGLYFCMCVTLQVCIKGREARKGYCRGGRFAFRGRGNYRRAHRRLKKEKH